MCGRSHGPDKVRVVSEEVESRRRGEDRKKWSFSFCVSCLWELSQLRLLQNAVIIRPCEQHSKATAVCHCVHLCVCVDVYIRSPLLTLY